MPVEQDVITEVHFITILDGHLQTHYIQITMAESDAQKLKHDLDNHNILSSPMTCESVTLSHIFYMLKHIAGENNVYIYKIETF